MTGYGKAEIKGNHYHVNVELKSVNHRYRDLRFKMSSVLNPFEIEARRYLENQFKRGSIEVSVNYKLDETTNRSIDLNEKKIKSFLSQIHQVTDTQAYQLILNPTELLKADFLEEDPNKQVELGGLFLEALQSASLELQSSRQIEGEKLASKLMEYTQEYEDHLQGILLHKEGFQEDLTNRLLDKFKELDQKVLDEARFLQEVVYYLEKIDIDEEVTRIQTHLDSLSKSLQRGGEMGRKIDFIVQELNRETNTIGSKSNKSEISQLVIEMKTRLEKIREQALNIE